MPTTALMIEALVNLRTHPGGVPDEHFWKLVERFRADLVNQALALLGSQNDAEDCAQETLSQAFLNLHRLRDPQKLGAWLRGINQRLVLNYRRRRARLREERFGTGEQNAVPDPHAEEIEVEKRAPTGPEDSVVMAIDELPGQFREVVVLRYWEKLDNAEIAVRLGLPEGTVRSRLSRADRMLAAKLQSLVKQQEHPQ